MRIFTYLLLLVALITNCNAYSVSDIPNNEWFRFILTKNRLKNEFNEWKESVAGKHAMENKLWGDSEHPSDDEKTLEERIRRFYLSKLRVEAQERMNPYATFTMDTPFTLLTPQEFKDHLGQSVGSVQEMVKMNRLNQGVSQRSLTQQAETPKATDWSTTKCAPIVRDQGKYCGACWAFASVSALESAYCIKHNDLPHLSVQHMISCSRSFKPNDGCNQGHASAAFLYVKNDGGLCHNKDYRYRQGIWPFHSTKTLKCRDKCDRFKVPVKDIAWTAPNDKELLEVVARQPVVIGVASRNDVWQHYKSGIVTSCDTTAVDHSVLVVGYGTENGKDYIKIQNSWGSGWGENGHMRLARGTGGKGTCSYLSESGVYPLLL